LADDPATGAALFDTPPRADQARADRTAQFDGTGQFDGTPQFDRTAQFDGAGQFDGTPQFDRTAQFDGTAQFDDTARVHGPARPQRAPRPGRSTGPRPTAPTGVLLLEHPRTAKPTTILARGVPSWSSEADIGVRKTASEHLPPAHRAASVLARALVEVLSGQRPLAQLRVHCAPEIYAGLGNRAAARQLALPHLLTVRVCEPADGVAEVSVAYRRADRVKALAFRIEGVDGRWRITALQLG
jgi:hypothetical protein